MANKSNNREQMLSMIEDWKQSGLSQKSYCEKSSIKYHRFHYWYKRFKAIQATSKEPQSSFIELQLPGAADKSCAEVIYPDGKRILFHQAVSVHFLKTLVI
jgi:hypothetical protein